MSHESNRSSDPLNFWLAVEAFSPQKVPARSKSPGDVPYVVDYSSQPLPWDAEAKWQPSRPGYVWQHTLYFGVFDLESAWTVLEPQAVEDFNARPSQSAVIMVTVREDGTLLPGTATLSQCVWASGQYIKRRRLADVFTDFSAAEKLWRKNLDDLIVERGIRVGADSPEGFRSHPATRRDLSAILTQALEMTGTRAVLTFDGKPVDGFRIKSEQISLKRGPEMESDFLNSHYSADLYRLSLQPRGRGSIRQYLGLDVPHGRVDVQQDLKAVYDSVAPDLVPDGRWPSDTGHSLALSQQFAVNRALADLGDISGIFSVNGPPGTGKTTMLRDMIAALVTKRAAALAAFRDPSKAFVEEGKLKSTGIYPRTVHRLHESLRGFEIVIASSNNGAVENISLEIPAKEDQVIAPQFQKNNHYFSEIATLLLSEKDNQGRWKRPLKEAWGLVSAKLGNSGNRNAFVSTALYTEKASDPEGLPAIPGMFDLLKDAPGTAAAVTWLEARQSFLAAQQKVHNLRAERQKLHLAFLELPILRGQIVKLEEELKTCTRQCQAQQGLVEEHSTDLARLHQLEHGQRADLETHIAAKPGLLEQIFTFGRVLAPWRARQTDLSAEMANTQTSITGLRLILDDGARTANSLHRHQQRILRALDSHQRRQQELEGAKTSYRYPKSFPSDQWFDLGTTERENAAPWLDKEFNEARSELFLEALKLHKAFILDQSPKMRQNLQAVQDVLKNAVAPEAQPAHVRWAWEALFMVVPTITTTFASAPRLFGSLQNEQLGWLFIDEAGQAPPQHAYCGIWRTHRTVLVGDPLQLTPVITLPDKYQDRLLEITRTHEKWLPARNPAQLLADRSTRYGTLIQPPGADEIWVGAPLRVHRRCDNPMFDAVNSEVYGGLMIHGGPTTLKDFPKGKPGIQAPPSAWFDIQTLHWNGHASPQEIAKLEELLQALKQSNYDMSEILVISPFKDTETRMSKVIRDSGMNAKTSAGTVHRAQGKEADIVIVVLGGTSGGARNWAVGTPNLFNVAVSRAKRRLYIIGDRRSWAGLQYFKALAPKLEIHHTDQTLSELFEPIPPKMETLAGS